MAQEENGVSANEIRRKNASDESALEPKSEVELTTQVRGIRNREEMILQNEENAFYNILLDATHRAGGIFMIAFIAFLESNLHEKYPLSSQIVTVMFPLSYLSLMLAVVLEKGKLFKILVCFGAFVQMSMLLLGITCAARRHYVSITD